MTDAERKLGQALEAIFASGRHGFDIVAGELNERGVSPPSSAAESWTPSLLQSELAKINASLDAAYAEAPSIGSYA